MQQAKLGDLLSLEYGISLPETKREPGIYPVYGSNGLVGYHKRPIVRGPGIIVGRKGSIGEITWSESDFWPIDTTFYVVLKKESVSLRWLYYLLPQLRLKDLNAATGIPGLNRNDAYAVKCYVPSIKEQTKITSILSKLDDLIQKIDQIIEQTQRLKKGLMQKLLTRGIGHEKFRTTTLGSKALSIRIPDSWEVKLLSEIAKIIDVRHSTPKYTTQGFPLVLPNNVRYEGLDLRNTKFTNKEDYLYMIDGGRKPAKGDIIYSRNATFGIACRVEDEIEFSLGQDLVLIKPEKIDPYLLYLILNSRSILIQLTRLSTGSTFQRINLELIRNYIIPYPKEIEEQKRISQILERISNFIYVSNRRRKTLNCLKAGLMQNLLTGEIRVIV